MSEFKVEPVPDSRRIRRVGLAGRVLDAVREAGDGQCVVVPIAGPDDLNTLRANLYGHRTLRPGEKVHVSIDSSKQSVRVWITTNGTTPK